MVQGGERLDAVGQQLVEQPIVEIEAFRIWRARSFRENARPRDREAIGLCTQRPHQLDIVLVAMEMIVRDISIAAIGNFAGQMSETIPDRRTSSIFVDGAFDLIGRGRRAPSKVARKGGYGVLAGEPALRGIGGFCWPPPQSAPPPS